MKRFKDFLSESTKEEYLYHATTREGLDDICSSGHLTTFKPSHGTDQDAWPDGRTEKRSYWGTSVKHVDPFRHDNSNSTVRTRVADHFKRERGTPDWYTTKKIPVKSLEYLHHGSWKPLGER